MKSLVQKDSFWAIIFLLPSVIGIMVFNFIPTITSFYLSFTKWNLLGSPKFVGLSNYLSLIEDPLFYKVLWQTLLFVAGTVFFKL